MKNLTKNPLGIIAIFLGVLYGVAGLLLAADSQPLSNLNQTILTVLVFLFPFVSLGVFAWLVSCHHAKLYAPRDYRSDRSFLDSVANPTPEERDAKIEKEAEALQIEQPPEAEPGQTDGQGDAAVVDASARAERTSSMGDRRRQVQLAEATVLDNIESEFGAFKRGAKLAARSGRDIVFDAMGLSSNDITLIEIVAAKYDQTLVMRARDVAMQFASVASTFPEDVNVKHMLCVVWLEGRPKFADRAITNASRLFEDIGLRSVMIREFPSQIDSASQSGDPAA